MSSNITEVPIEGTPEISKYNFTCDKPICPDIPKPLPGSQEGFFRIAIVGKSGSGKTNALRNLTERGGKYKVYCKKFSNVFYVSPSIHTMDKKPKLPEDRFYTSVLDLPEIINRIQTEDGLEGRTLLILDDISNELKSGGGRTMEIVKRVFMLNRHLGRAIEDEEGNQIEPGAMSVIILGQRTNALPPYVRSQITHWILFDPRSTKSEMKTIFEELMFCNKNDFNEMMRRAFSKPYGFLFLDTTRSKMYKGFNTEFQILKEQYL